jgi:hypothetical protein
MSRNVARACGALQRGGAAVGMALNRRTALDPLHGALTMHASPPAR